MLDGIWTLCSGKNNALIIGRMLYKQEKLEVKSPSKRQLQTAEEKVIRS